MLSSILYAASGPILVAAAVALVWAGLEARAIVRRETRHRADPDDGPKTT